MRHTLWKWSTLKKKKKKKYIYIYFLNAHSWSYLCTMHQCTLYEIKKLLVFVIFNQKVISRSTSATIFLFVCYHKTPPLRLQMVYFSQAKQFRKEGHTFLLIEMRSHISFRNTSGCWNKTGCDWQLKHKNTHCNRNW